MRQTPLSLIRRHARKLLGLCAGLFVVVTAAQLRAEPAGRGKVALGIVSGAIDPGSGDFIKSAIVRAEKGDYEALVLQLDTPGGLLSTTREIVQAILGSQVPVVVYVAPAGARAGSAGVFITLAGHVAAMAPATNIGAAHPVTLGGGGKDKDDKGESDVMSQKIENDTAAFVESIARERGRNVEWAISSVRHSESIPATKALELGVVDLVATDLDDLLGRIDGRVVKLGPSDASHTLRTRGAQVVELDWGLRHRFLHVIGEPSLASILLALGALGLMVEFYKPGAIVPGVVGVILLVLGGLGISVLPVNVGAVALLLLGIAFFVAELFVTSFGLLGVAGAICFGAGGILLVDNTGSDFFADSDFGVSPAAFLPTAAFFAVTAVAVGYAAMKAWRAKPRVGASGLVGMVGEVDRDIAPGGEGLVFVHGELWRAVSAHPLAKGASARVVAVDGLTVRVEEAA